MEAVECLQLSQHRILVFSESRLHRYLRSDSRLCLAIPSICGLLTVHGTSVSNASTIVNPIIHLRVIRSNCRFVIISLDIEGFICRFVCLISVNILEIAAVDLEI